MLYRGTPVWPGAHVQFWRTALPGGDVLSGGQAEHAEAAATLWNVPGGQRWQPCVPIVSLYVVAVQGWQGPVAGPKYPGGHAHCVTFEAPGYVVVLAPVRCSGHCAQV